MTTNYILENNFVIVHTINYNYYMVLLSKINRHTANLIKQV